MATAMATVTMAATTSPPRDRVLLRSSSRIQPILAHGAAGKTPATGWTGAEKGAGTRSGKRPETGGPKPARVTYYS